MSASPESAMTPMTEREVDALQAVAGVLPLKDHVSLYHDEGERCACLDEILSNIQSQVAGNRVLVERSEIEGHIARLEAMINADYCLTQPEAELLSALRRWLGSTTP